MSHQLANEQALVGACLLAPDLVAEIAPYLLPADFVSPLTRCAWSAIVALHERGEALNVLSLSAEALRHAKEPWDGVRADLLEWEAQAPTRGAVPTLVRLIGEASTRRKLVRFAQDAEELATDEARGPDDVMDELKDRLASIDVAGAAAPDTTVELADFLVEPEEMHAATVIPGIAFADTRTIIVAPEGVGKSYLLTQIAALAAVGKHPFRFTPMEPQPGLVIDLENPRDALRGRLQRLFTVGGIIPPQREELRLLSRPEGLDIRRRRDRLEIETAIRKHRPALVTIGPLYKLYQRKDRETDEAIAQELQNILDDLRTRYGFALMIEHHAPQSIAGAREIRPYGSSYWLRWPEIGISLSRKDGRDDLLAVGRWRGDRFPSDWPVEFERGQVFPFSGRWEKSA